VTALLEATPHAAVVVVDRRLNILARNRLAEAAFGVVDQDTPYATNCDDKELKALIEELSAYSGGFRRMWAALKGLDRVRGTFVRAEGGERSNHSAPAVMNNVQVNLESDGPAVLVERRHVERSVVDNTVSLIHGRAATDPVTLSIAGRNDEV
jgi:hypothetical protein